MCKCMHTIGVVKRNQGRRGKWGCEESAYYYGREGKDIGIVMVNLDRMWNQL